MPSDAQKKAGNYPMLHLRVAGLPVSIENRKGSIRCGTGAHGEWSVKMPVHYGYIKRTTGADGDNVDCFVGPDRDSQLVVVVNQFGTTHFDEHKIMLGFKTLASAKAAYRRSFNGVPPRAEFKVVTLKRLKQWLASGQTWNRFLFANRERLVQLQSALRKRVSITHDGQPGVSPSYVMSTMKVGGKIAGHMQTEGNAVRSVAIQDEFRGLGLGKKLYGEMMKKMPGRKLVSDTAVSDSAERVWNSLGRRPGITVKAIPSRYGHKTYAGQLRRFARVGKLTVAVPNVKTTEFRQPDPKEEQRSRAARIARVVAPLAVAGGAYYLWHKSRPKVPTRAVAPDVPPASPAVAPTKVQVAAPVVQVAEVKAPKKPMSSKVTVPAGKRKVVVNKLAALHARMVLFNDQNDEYRNQKGASSSLLTAYRKGRRLVPLVRRGTQASEDLADIASGRKVKDPFYKKAWFKAAVTGAAIAAPVAISRKVNAWHHQDRRFPGSLPHVDAIHPAFGKLKQKAVKYARVKHPYLTQDRPLFSDKRPVVSLDVDAEFRGWDLRDPRGRSARVYAPGSRRRDRREKTALEKVDNIRLIRNVALVAAGAGAAGLTVAGLNAKRTGRNVKQQYRKVIAARGGPRLPVKPGSNIIAPDFRKRALSSIVHPILFRRKEEPAIHRVIDAAKNQVKSAERPQLPGEGVARIVLENPKTRVGAIRILGAGALAGGGTLAGIFAKRPKTGALLGGLGAGLVLRR